MSVIGTTLDATKERDTFLAQLFAEGYSDDDILLIADQQGFDLSEDRLKEKRLELRPAMLHILQRQGEQLLAKVAHCHKPFRVREMSAICDILQKGIDWCAERNEWHRVAKLSEVFLRANRHIAEEVQDIQPAHHGLNVWLNIVQSAPPEQRKAIVSKLQEVKALAEVGEAVVLPPE
jgi:hypothetical protein